MNNSIRILIGTLLVVMSIGGSAFGRGFGGGGGFRGGGGFGGGGFGGGGFGGGDRFGGGGGFAGGGGDRYGGGGGGFGGGDRFGGGGFGGDRFGGGLGGPNSGIGTRPGAGPGDAGFGGSAGFGGGFAGSGRTAGGFGGGLGGPASGAGFRPGAGFGEAGLGGRFGMGGGAFAADRFSGASRSQLNSWLGLPSDAGMHSVAGSHPMGNDFNVNSGTVQGPRGGEAAGVSVTGPRGNTEYAGAAVGAGGGAVAGRGVEGAGGAGAARVAGVGPGGQEFAGSAVRGPEGATAARGATVGPYGAAAGFRYTSPTGRYTSAAAVRSNFYGYHMYSPAWYTDHPGAWYAAGWATGSAWTAASWAAASSWCGCDSEPESYDYGSTVTYENNNVYVNGQDAGSSDQYYQQANGLANTGVQAQPTDQEQWLPLGVFAMTHGNQSDASMVLQLALDKQGVLRGNYNNTLTGETVVAKGSVDKKTQRAAWVLGSNADTVYEAGLYDLTKDEVPMLVHFGKERTEQWMLVRLKKPDAADSPPGPPNPAANGP